MKRQKYGSLRSESIGTTKIILANVDEEEKTTGKLGSCRSMNHEIQEPDGAKQQSVLENREKEVQGPAVTDVLGCVCAQDSDQRYR